MLRLNKYHRGFNRLWLVFSCLLAFAFVGLKGLNGAYTVPRPQFIHVLPLGTRLGASTPPLTEAEKQAIQKKEAEFKRQKWIERGRAAKDLCLSFIVAFVFGHGGFYLVVWIIRGFR